MARVSRRDSQFTDAWGITIHTHSWEPKGSPRAVIQIAHGLGEHALRYETLAQELVDHGYAVYAQEHRGHGPTGLEQWGGDLAKMGRLGPGGLRATIATIAQFRDAIDHVHPETPVIFLGHSWGSLMGQILLNQGFASRIDGVVFSGSTYRMPGYMNAGNLNARHAHLGDTGAEWLSRDVAVHQRWVDDDLAFEANTLKLFGPLDAARLIGRPRPVGRDLPMLLLVGSDDSLGGEAGVRRLERAYRERGGLSNITTIVYPDARHEVFNETNRDEVVGDLVEWLSRTVPSSKK